MVAPAPDDHGCFIAGCPDVASFGFRPNREVAYKWACFAHRHLLERKAPEAKPLPAAGKPGDLFGRER